MLPPTPGEQAFSTSSRSQTQPRLRYSAMWGTEFHIRSFVYLIFTILDTRPDDRCVSTVQLSAP
jgi:hypothetical protein